MSIDIDLLEWAVEEGLKLGADEVELFASSVQHTSSEIMLASFPKMSSIIDLGIGIRVIKDKKIGFSFVTRIERDPILNSLKDAISSANASKPIDDWKNLPEPSSYPTVKNTYDPRIEKLTSDSITDYLNRLLSKIVSIDKRINPVQVGAGYGVIEKVIVNSNGVKVSDKGTVIYAVAATIGMEGDKRTPYCFDYDVSRILELNPELVGERVAEITLTSLKTGRPETEKSTVLFHPFALSSILTFTLTVALNGDSIKREISPFVNKIGEKIGSEKLTLIDDGTVPGGIGTTISDDEGVPTRRKILIENGILRGFYFDNYTGKALGKESTGNGFRTRGTGGGTSISYASLPTPSPSNLSILPGDASLEEIISEINRGYFVIGVQGAHSSNPESGEVSVAGAPIWKIENGEIVGAVPGTMISGKLYDLLKHIRFISKETRIMENYILPYVAFENVNVISKK